MHLTPSSYPRGTRLVAPVKLLSCLATEYPAAAIDQSPAPGSHDPHDAARQQHHAHRASRQGTRTCSGPADFPSLLHCPSAAAAKQAHTLSGARCPGVTDGQFREGWGCACKRQEAPARTAEPELPLISVGDGAYCWVTDHLPLLWSLDELANSHEAAKHVELAEILGSMIRSTLLRRTGRKDGADVTNVHPHRCLVLRLLCYHPSTLYPV